MSRRPSPSTPLIAAFFVVVGLFVYLNLEFSQTPEAKSQREKEGGTRPPDAFSPKPPAAPTLPLEEKPASAPPPPEPSDDYQGNPFFRTYGHESQSVQDDLEAIHRTLDVFWTLMKNPDLLRVDSNATITAFLSGQNPEKMELIPADSPFIDAQGQLLDRWGTPIYFHPISLSNIEVRSAGPDKRLFTEDDLEIAARRQGR